MNVEHTATCLRRASMNRGDSTRRDTARRLATGEGFARRGANHDALSVSSRTLCTRALTANKHAAI